MKRKTIALIVALTLMICVTGCKKKATGRLGSEDLLTMVPEGAVALIGFNLQQLTSLGFFSDTIKKDWQKNAKAGKAFKDYQDFVRQTGIDLEKDLYASVVAVYGGFDSENPEMAGVINMKYDQAKLLAVFRDKQLVSGEEKYRNLTIYTMKTEEKDKQKDMRLCFLNKGNILVGSPVSVKKAIDLGHREGKNVLQTAALMKYAGPLNKKGMLWLVVGSIPSKVKNATGGGMMPVDLSKAEAFTAFTDYTNKTLSGELRMVSRNEAGNKQIADMLNGLKALGAMGAAKEPDLGELLNGIQLSSAADHVKLTFTISEALLNRLGAKAKEKAKNAVPAASPDSAPLGRLP